MLETVKNTREFLKKNGIDYMLVNSTNQFLVEYNSLEENSRYFLTDFTGSTGDALISQSNVFLFVDGRYHIQADLEVNHDVVGVVKLQTGQTFLEEIVARIKPNSIFALVSKKNSQLRIEAIQEKLKEKNVKILLLDEDPIKDRAARTVSETVDIDIKYTGMSVDEKIKKASGNLEDNEAVLITNLEEVSYLFNKRDFSKPYASNIKGKAVLLKNKAFLYDEAKLGEFEKFIRNDNGVIYADKSSINGYDFRLLGDKAKVIKDSPVKLMKSVKTDAEIEHLKDAFKRTDLAVSAIRDYIEENENLTEFDIAQKLEEFYKQFGAKSLSFKSIVAKDKNSALAHYSKSSKDEIIKDGSLILIDSGAYYEGGLATDITRVFVKGEPSQMHRKVYTTVLKMFLHAYNYQPSPDGTGNYKITGYEIDDLARQICAENEIEGFVFNHGLGHGIGVSVHEYPPNLSKNELAKVEIKDNMVFSIEPGLYNENHFGIRLENSCFMENGRIRSLVHMNYEKKLIDYSLLTKVEKEWLKEFEVK